MAATKIVNALVAMVDLGKELLNDELNTVGMMDDLAEAKQFEATDLPAFRIVPQRSKEEAVAQEATAPRNIELTVYAVVILRRKSDGSEYPAETGMKLLAKIADKVESDPTLGGNLLMVRGCELLGFDNVSHLVEPHSAYRMEWKLRACVTPASRV